MPIWNITIGSVEWFLGNVSLTLLSLLLWSHLRFHRFPIDLALLLFYFITNTTFFIFIMGVSGLLEKNIMGGICLFVSLVFLLTYKRCIISSLKEIRGEWKDFRLHILQHPFLVTGFVITALLVGLRMMAHVWFLSPYVWDTLTYHLPKVADWVQYGKLVALPTPVARSYWPANFELFQTWFVLFFHHDFLIEAAGLPFYLLAVFSVYSSGRSLELSRNWSASLAVIYALTPSVFMNAVSCKNDIAVAALYLFLLSVMLDLRRHKDQVGSHAAVIGAAILIAIGIKPYMVFILPGLMLIGFWCFGMKQTGSKQTTGLDYSIPVVCFLLTTALILGVYWYVRNYWLFDNPFYPADFRLFGQLIFGDGQGGAQQGSFRWESLLRNFLDLAGKKIFDPFGPYDPDVENKSGWGWFVFSCGIPALVFAVMKRTEFRWLIAGFLLSLACLFGMVSPDPWNMRFTLWFPAIFVLGYGIVTSRIEIKYLRGGLILLAGVCSALNLLGCLGTGYVYTSPSMWQAQAAIPVWERTFTADHIRPALRIIRPDDQLAYIAHGDTWIYPLYGPGYNRKIHYLKPYQDVDMVQEMKRMGVRYLLLLDADDKSWIQRINQEVHQGRITQVADRLYCLTDVRFK
jgi:hypothetical protein